MKLVAVRKPRAARLAYPIRDDIPVMLEDEARELSDEEIEQLGK